MLWESLLPPSLMGDPSRTITDAKDYILSFADGRKAIDLTSGLWNVNFSYGNPFVAARIEKIIRDGHYATLFRHSHPAAQEVAQRLLSHLDLPDASLIFSTSGSALNDVMVKLAYQWNALVGRRARTIVSIKGSYHGMTLNSMRLSGDELSQLLYSAKSPNFVHLPIDDSKEWKRFFETRGNSVALVVLEPVLGSGAIPLPAEILEIIFAARKQYGFLVGADEVAMGFYRLGKMAGSFGWQEPADLLGFSKGLTNGTAASSALVVREQIAQAFIESDSLFMHGETQAGSPMSCAAILGVLDFLDSIDIVARYRELENLICCDLGDLAQKHHLHRHGKGLFQYLGWKGAERFSLQDFSGLKVTEFFRTHGISVQPSLQGIQIIPAITMPESTWKEAFSKLDEAFTALKSGREK